MKGRERERGAPSGCLLNSCPEKLDNRVEGKLQKSISQFVLPGFERTSVRRRVRGINMNGIVLFSFERKSGSVSVVEGRSV